MRARVFGLLIALVAGSAQAVVPEPVITVTLDSITDAGIAYPGAFRWSYSATAAYGDMGCYSNSPQAFFRLLDLPGTLQTVTAAAPGWGATSGMDNGALYVEFGRNDNGATPCSEILPASGFEIILSVGEPVFSNYIWQACAAYPCDNTVVRGEGVVADGRDPGNPVPEPGTLALLGLGVAGLGIARRRQRPAAPVVPVT